MVSREQGYIINIEFLDNGFPYSLLALNHKPKTLKP